MLYRALKGVLCHCTLLKTYRIKGAQNQNFRVNITAMLSICKPFFKTLLFERERGGEEAVAVIKYILELFFITSCLFGLKIVVPALACFPFAGYFLTHSWPV